MPNVFDLTSRLPERPPLDLNLLLQIAQRMSQLNKLSGTGLGIAALAISRMQAAGEYRCSLTRQELVSSHITLDGAPFASVCNPEIDELARALFALQSFCGLWNHVSEDRVGKGKSRYNHFVEKYLISGTDPLRQVIKRDTSIHFMWIPEHADELVEEVRAAIAHQLNVAKWADVTTVKLG